MTPVCANILHPPLTSCFLPRELGEQSDRLAQDVAFRAGVTKRQQKPQPACAPDGAKLLDAVPVGARYLAIVTVIIHDRMQ